MADDQFRRLVELLPQIVWASTADGSVEFVNAQWTRYTGLSVAESLGTNPALCIYPDDRRNVQGAWQNALETGRPFETEMRLRRHDGGYEWFLSRCVPVFDESQAPKQVVLRWIGTSTNINLRKQVEQDQDFTGELVMELRRLREPGQISARLVTALATYLELDACVLLEQNVQSGQVRVLADFLRPEATGAQGQAPTLFWDVLANVADHALQDGATAFALSNFQDAPDPTNGASPGASSGGDGTAMIGAIASVNRLPDDYVDNQAVNRQSPSGGLAGGPHGRALLLGVQFQTRSWRAHEQNLIRNLAGSAWLAYQRTLMERSLADSEARFRLALEDSPITVYTTDCELRYSWIFNPPLGKDAESMIGRRDDEIFSAQGAAELMRFKQDVLATGKLMRRVVEVADIRDYTRYDLTAMPIYDSTGSVAGLTVAAADITERERAETRLSFLAEASEVLMASLDYHETLERLGKMLVPMLANWCALDLVVDGELKQVVVAHENPKMVAWANELRRRYPASLDDEHGVAQVIRTGRPEFHPYISDELLRLSARDEEHYRIIRRVGMRSALVVPLRLRERILGALTMVWSDSQRNYTEADLRFAEELARRAAVAIENARLYQETREAEAQLRKLNENLEQRVQERTLELERSNHELDRFAYVASHDLKAPLRAIEHLATWVEEDAGAMLPESSQEHLAKMRGRIARMEALLDDLLTYSRAGRVRGDAAEVDTDALLEAVIETVTPPQGFRINLLHTLPRLQTYRAPLETIFRNLIGNAIKHHPTGDGAIEIFATDAGAWVEFCVRDDGDGIRPEFHERIFEMFQTLRPRDQIEGSGIGLAVVKKIVESAGGSIRVESEAGKGAAFYFMWPKVWQD